MSAKQAINDKLQGSVATYLRCSGGVKNQIKKLLLLSRKTDMLRSIGKQSGESVESVPEKKRKATVGRICRKRFHAWNERVKG